MSRCNLTPGWWIAPACLIGALVWGAVIWRAM